MSGAAMAMPQDPKAAFKAEWEALEIAEHKWALKDVEVDLLQKAEVDCLFDSFSFANNTQNVISLLETMTFPEISG